MFYVVRDAQVNAFRSISALKDHKFGIGAPYCSIHVDHDGNPTEEGGGEDVHMDIWSDAGDEPDLEHADSEYASASMDIGDSQRPSYGAFDAKNLRREGADFLYS